MFPMFLFIFMYFSTLARTRTFLICTERSSPLSGFFLSKHPFISIFIYQAILGWVHYVNPIGFATLGFQTHSSKIQVVLIIN